MNRLSSFYTEKSVGVKRWNLTTIGKKKGRKRRINDKKVITVHTFRSMLLPKEIH